MQKTEPKIQETNMVQTLKSVCKFDQIEGYVSYVIIQLKQKLVKDKPQVMMVKVKINQKNKVKISGWIRG